MVAVPPTDEVAVTPSDLVTHASNVESVAAALDTAIQAGDTVKDHSRRTGHVGRLLEAERDVRDPPAAGRPGGQAGRMNRSSGLRSGPLLVVLLAGMVMNNIDIAIVNVAGPAVRA